MSLRDFTKIMEKNGEVLHIIDELSTDLEIAYVMGSLDDRGPVLFFDKIKGWSGRILSNVSGSRKRLGTALGVAQQDVYDKLRTASDSPLRPKVSDDGPAMECHERAVNLCKLPILRHFDGDGGAYVTAGVVYAKSPDGSIENASIHRLQVLDRNHLAIRLVPRHLFKLWCMAKENNRDLEVSVSVGVHPAVLLASSCPLPFGVSEFDVANALLDNQLRLVKCVQVDACAPAQAELVLEGKIKVAEMTDEGPFVDITGTYDIKRRQPVVEIVGVMHREDYIYNALLPSGSEHRLLMGLPHEALIWDAVSKVVPRVCEVNLSLGGCGWLHAAISIEKNVDGDAKNALLAAFAAHSSLKHAVVVDSDIDVCQATEVEWAIATRFQANEDLVVLDNIRGSTLDSSADQQTGLTSKVGVDATRPLGKPKEKFAKARMPADERLDALIKRLKRL